ncbi:ComEC/Rec2 family competence protein [Massilia sp. GCM10023247]|uniref:ComEC/Rec2 family competence protein n=1 Tax=Massilia sp. GCM10023247 TaxID=3252643 RepID=UPI00360FF40A
MTSFFEVKLIQAEHGDAILVSYGENPVRHILVDGGPASSLPNLLEVLSASRTNGTLTLEAIVVTHYDFDHIGGIIALLEQMPDWVVVNDIWFNGYKHALPQDLLGPRHSEALTDLIVKNRLPWNKAFKEHAVCACSPGSIDLPGGISIWVLSPTKKELAALAKQSPAQLLSDGNSGLRDRLGRRDAWPPPPFSSLVGKRFLPDQSVSNASSIALLLNYGDKQILLSGDAHADVVCSSLAYYWPRQKVKLDLLKVSHHGSQANTSADFLRRIECKRFAFSTNGKIHAHPDQALIARLIGSISNPELIFNYASPWVNRWRNRPAAWPKYLTSYPSADDAFVRVAV